MADQPRTPLLVIDWPRFGRSVQQAREARGLAKPNLQYRTGVSVQTLRRIEAGRSCTPEAMLTLCAWMGEDPFIFTRPKQDKEASHA